VTTRRRLAAAWLALAATISLAACGLDAAGDPANGGSASPTASGDSGRPAAPATQTPVFGRAYTYPNGVSVTVSAPQAFTPSATASPQFEHAVSFELTVHNGTDKPYDMARLRLEASVNGHPAGEEIIDSTKGYPGLRGVSTQLPPARSNTLQLAYGSDEWPSRAGLRVRIGPQQRAIVEFSGPVES